MSKSVLSTDNYPGRSIHFTAHVELCSVNIAENIITKKNDTLATFLAPHERPVRIIALGSHHGVQDKFQDTV